MCSHVRGVCFCYDARDETNAKSGTRGDYGLLHNYYFYKTDINDFPNPNSSETVRPLLRDMDFLAKEE